MSVVDLFHTATRIIIFKYRLYTLSWFIACDPPMRYLQFGFNALALKAHTSSIQKTSFQTCSHSCIFDALKSHLQSCITRYFRIVDQLNPLVRLLTAKLNYFYQLHTYLEQEWKNKTIFFYMYKLCTQVAFVLHLRIQIILNSPFAQPYKHRLRAYVFNGRDRLTTYLTSSLTGCDYRNRYRLPYQRCEEALASNRMKERKGVGRIEGRTQDGLT